jgi:hypothetical protein
MAVAEPRRCSVPALAIGCVFNESVVGNRRRTPAAPRVSPRWRGRWRRVGGSGHRLHRAEHTKDRYCALEETAIKK